MTPAELAALVAAADEVLALDAQATPGPWMAASLQVTNGRIRVAQTHKLGDLAFIARTRTLAPELARGVRALADENARLRADTALESDGGDIPGREIEDVADSAVAGLVVWVTRLKKECAARGSVFDAGFRCVSEGGAIWYFDPESIVALAQSERAWREYAERLEKAISPILHNDRYSGGPAWSVSEAEIAALHVAIASKPGPVCSGCKKEIDPDTCGCGDARVGHENYGGHPFVPIGCNCLRAPDASLTNKPGGNP